MNNIIDALLSGRADNHVLPFFWQHGEEEAVLRNYMKAIHQSGCGAVCVESRPHPDFCGPKWWTDLDVILDEARKRDMKVWILDDAHFPTGFANGAAEKAPPELCRQSICAHRILLDHQAHRVEFALSGMIPPPFIPNKWEEYKFPIMPKPRQYKDDTILYVSAFCAGTGESIDLSPFINENTLRWEKPRGDWVLWICGLSRNCGPHRNYINMTDRESCHLLIDAVYEPHWTRYKADFGKTIAGFFSDEPELGNGHLYDMEAFMGKDNDMPFGREMPEELVKRLGARWPSLMYLLWENHGEKQETAHVRYAFMDAVTTLVSKNFSFQIGDWCRAHGVQYIGHVVEDNGAHARTASSLGHFFRGMYGQDMAGIDDIGGQVYPQGENDNSLNHMGRERSAEFYHFMLGRLGSSAAAIEPLKKGRAMCEIFGDYGWSAGVQLFKYLADHFMVRGINYFVPHAFSPKPFPDPDCPPHFYAHGHNPQFRHFGELIRYMNRVCTLTSSGLRMSEVAVLYHAEAEWAGERMTGEKPARVLEENQISFDFIPGDIFAESLRFNAEIGDTLRVNTQEYSAILVPTAQFLPHAVAEGLAKLHRMGFTVIFINSLPEGVCDGDNKVLDDLQTCTVLPLHRLVTWLNKQGIGKIKASPAHTYLRVLRIGERNFFFVNEDAATYTGTVTVPVAGFCYAYDPWHNRLETIETEPREKGIGLRLTLEPRKSVFVLFDEPHSSSSVPVKEGKVEIPLDQWKRSVCESLAYPDFSRTVDISLPDTLAKEQPEFSGFVRYTTTFKMEHPDTLVLVISDAAEGVEVFVNGQSAGIQIVPPYRYDISQWVGPGENELAIEVATTLERKCYPLLEPRRKAIAGVPSAGSGLTGTVKLYKRHFEYEEEET